MRLHEIQQNLHVAKDKRNDFGKYNYRTAEGILSELKSILLEGEVIIITDELTEMCGQIFVKSTATLHLDGQKSEATGFAMHPLTKKGMDPSQITGTASSYARKYALNGLLAIDDGSADPDAAKEPYEPAPFDAKAAMARIADGLDNCKTKPDLLEYWGKERDTAILVGESDKNLGTELFDKFNELREALALEPAGPDVGDGPDDGRLGA